MGALLTIVAALRLKPMASAAVPPAWQLLAAGLAALAYHLAGLALDPVAQPWVSPQWAGQRPVAIFGIAPQRGRHPQEFRATLAGFGRGQAGGRRRAALRIAGEERIVTALFTDIEDFTAMTSALAPKDLVRLLDGYFEGVTRIVAEHGGMVDKIVGDAAHAFFNMPLALTATRPRRSTAPTPSPISPKHSDRRRMPRRRQVSAAPASASKPARCWRAMSGRPGRYDYSAHGPAVNLAARLQEANKQTGTTILAGPGLKAAKPLGWDLVSLGQLDLRGLWTNRSLAPPAGAGVVLKPDAGIGRIDPGLPHVFLGLGGWPSAGISHPSPASSRRRHTCRLNPTDPRSTKTPNAPLLGPAKNFVPRTAMRPKRERTVSLILGKSSARSNSMAPSPSSRMPPDSATNLSISNFACDPRCTVVPPAKSSLAKLSVSVSTCPSAAHRHHWRDRAHLRDRRATTLPRTSPAAPTISSAAHAGPTMRLAGMPASNQSPADRPYWNFIHSSSSAC